MIKKNTHSANNEGRVFPVSKYLLIIPYVIISAILVVVGILSLDKISEHENKDYREYSSIINKLQLTDKILRGISHVHIASLRAQIIPNTEAGDNIINNIPELIQTNTTMYFELKGNISDFLELRQLNTILANRKDYLQGVEILLDEMIYMVDKELVYKYISETIRPKYDIYYSSLISYADTLSQNLITLNTSRAKSYSNLLNTYRSVFLLCCFIILLGGFLFWYQFRLLEKHKKQFFEEQDALGEATQLNSSFASFISSFHASIALLEVQEINGDKLLKFIYSNNNFKNEFELQSDTISLNDSTNNLYSEDEVIQLFDAIIDQKSVSFNERILIKDGKLHVLKPDVLPISKNQIFITFEDITEIKNLEQISLLKNFAMDSVHEGIIITDAQQNDNPIIYANNEFLKLTGYSLGEVIGRNCRFLQGPETDAETVLMIRENIQNGVSVKCEILNYKKDGHPMWSKLLITPIRDSFNKITHYIGIQIDITKRKLNEEENRLLTEDVIKRNSALQHFAFITNHNIRQPVANIMGLINVLKETSLNENGYEQVLELLHKASISLDDVLTDMNLVLQLEKPIHDKISKIDLRLFLPEILESYSDSINSYGIKINLDCKELTSIYQNEYLLHHVVSSIFSNAIKYRDTNKQCKIIIKTYSESNREIIEIHDNGVGVNTESSTQHLFGLYNRFHPEIQGKGLGLFMSQRMAETMGGDIDFMSTIGEGSTFRIRLPNLKD